MEKNCQKRDLAASRRLLIVDYLFIRSFGSIPRLIILIDTDKKEMHNYLFIQLTLDVSFIR